MHETTAIILIEKVYEQTVYVCVRTRETERECE